ncbi:MAG: hypothetical protein CMO74_15010 [Verrucomicrobiales bacterium]|nr:hypothetical protein [Verrucomicrobiales bacterium]
MKWQRLEKHLDPLAGRQRQLRTWRALGVCWMAGLLAVAAMWAAEANSFLAIPAVALGVALLAVIAVARARNWRPNYHDLARRIERDNPQLHAVLLTALEQEPDPQTGELNFLQQRVINDAVAEAQQGRWIESVPAARLTRAEAFHAVALVALVASFTQLVPTAKPIVQAINATTTHAKLQEVQPGNTAVEQDTAVTITATFKDKLPREAKLILHRGEEAEELEMTAKDGVITATVAVAKESFKYRVEFSGGESEEFEVTVLNPAILLGVEPGDKEVERGASLAFLAKFADRMPANARLVLQPAQGKARTLAMSPKLQDPIFSAVLPEVNEPMQYWVEFDGGKSEAFEVKVYEHPVLESADAKLTFPKYTGREPREQKDVRRLTAVAGTQLEYTMHLNKPVAQARLVAADDSVIELKPEAGQPLARLPVHVLKKTGVYRLELVDNAERKNKYAPQFEFVVQANLPPSIRLVFPRGDQKVSPLEEVLFEAEMEDDFGLLRYGLSYNIGGGAMQEIELGQDAPANIEQAIATELALEEMGVEVDQLINYYFWAEDLGDDGQPRRTFGDMFFAEVRPFEEIFREGQSMPQNSQQQQQQGKKGNQQTEELIKLQKQIINATWRLIRRETGVEATARFAADALTLFESQQKAFSQAKVLLDKSSDEKTHGYVKAVVEHMQRAIGELEKATGEGVTAPLPSALAAEQAAYQSLLKLQAHEHRVARGNPKQSGGQQSQRQGNNRQQQQLNQLELKQQENKYATEKQAQRLQDPKQRENLQALNRLKELAERQKDLTDKLKELQQALREAKTEQEKKDIRRRLKQLRDEQKQNIEDADKLAQRMDQRQNRAEMKDSRQQLQQTRQQMNQAAEQLKQGEVSQALANSTKAQKDLQEMRDDFRKKTSHQFAEQMKQMRREARDLAKDEKKLGEKIEDLNERPRRTLTDSPERKQLADAAKAQGEKLERLLDDVKKTVQQSELTEPTLSRKLYDTFRDAKQQQTGRALNTAAELLKEGFTPQAGELEKKARRDIDNLKKGIEKAAEPVLGNDTEALKHAERTLDELSEAIKKEMGQQTGNEPKPGEPQKGKPQAGKGQPPKSKPQQQAGKSQPQKGKPQQQAGKGKPSDPQKGQPQKQAGKGQPQKGQPQKQASKGQPQKGQPQAGKQPGSFLEQMTQQKQPQRPGPITGGGDNWTDQLRDVEEMVEVPGVAERVSKARDQIRSLNKEFKRHSKKPQWDLVQSGVLNPIEEARARILEELARRDDQPSLAPIDRDPAPSRFIDAVKRYTEQLGRGD